MLIKCPQSSKNKKNQAQGMMHTHKEREIVDWPWTSPSYSPNGKICRHSISLESHQCFNYKVQLSKSIFFLNTHLHQMGFYPIGNGRKSHLSLFLSETISLSMANLQDSLSSISIVSFTILGSWVLANKENIHIKLDGL